MNSQMKLKFRIDCVHLLDNQIATSPFTLLRYYGNAIKPNMSQYIYMTRMSCNYAPVSLQSILFQNLLLVFKYDLMFIV
jgi:hypothetical protein